MEQYHSSQNKEVKNDAQIIRGHETYDSVKILGSFNEATMEQFGAVVAGYNFFKDELFDKPLPPVIFTLNENAHSRGYFRSDARVKDTNKFAVQINISPSTLLLPPIEVFGTLVHEMCHSWHCVYGKPGWWGYHNMEFAEIMEKRGLVCSHSGKPGGRKVGKKMRHYIEPYGLFANAFENLPDCCRIPFTPNVNYGNPAQSPNKLPVPKPKIDLSKTKYTCRGCGAAAWGKPTLHLICGQCNDRMIIIDQLGVAQRGETKQIYLSQHN